MKQGPKSVVASVLARLRNEQAALGVPFNQVLQFYVMERFLCRLSKSAHVDGVLLKGALLLKTVGIPRARPTMDIDLLWRGRADPETLIALVRDCASIDDPWDAVTFDPASIVAEVITRDAEYLGTRVRIAARMDNVRLAVQSDFAVGDRVVPGPRVIEYPTLLEKTGIRLRAYPVEAAVAEKFQAMIELDMANSRMKDFYDIRAYSHHLAFDGATLAKLIAATFSHRATRLPALPPDCVHCGVLRTGVTPAAVAGFLQAYRGAGSRRPICRRRDGCGGIRHAAGHAAAGSSPFQRKWLPGGPWTGPPA